MNVLKNKVVIAAIFFAVVLILLFALFYVVGVRKPNYYLGTEKVVEVTIEKGLSVREVAKLLKEKSLINSEVTFILYVFLNPDKKIQAGRYSIPTNLSIVELIELLKKGSFEKKLTFIEGWRVEEMAYYLSKKFNKEFALRFLDSSLTKEGFMFPDTYFVYDNITPHELAGLLRENFNRKIANFEPEVSDSKLSLQELVVLASIVEREAYKSDDKRIIAGILIKRYFNGWPLQADATIQYAKASELCRVEISRKCNWWPKIHSEDLEIESPYNTYKNAGLTPTPISNPGLDSIEAVLNYKETPFWFYLTDDKGNTYYARTLEEHNSNIERYLR